MKRILIAAVTLSLGIAIAAWGQDYPSKPIRVVIPYIAGNVGEVIFRNIIRAVEPRLGQRFIVDDKPGADGNIGTAEVVRATPDGYTLLLAPTGNFAMVTHLYKNLGFDPLTQLEPISMLVETWPLGVVAPNVPAKSLKELADYVRANPGKYNYGSQGSGSGAHLIGAAFNQAVGNAMVHVPYKGSPPMMQALAAGDIQVVFASMASVIGALKAGKARAVAIIGKDRLEELPDVPTAPEQGFPQLVLPNWWALAAPKGVSPQIVNRLYTEFRTGLADPDVRLRLKEVAHIPVGLSPADSSAFFRSESARYKAIIEQNNIRLE